mgnify:CR=1 FL=1
MVRSGVLSAELELTDLDARQVKHWWQLLVPPGVLAQPRWALVVLDRGAVLKIVISGQGAVPPVALPGLPRPGPRTLAGWASQLGVAAVIAVERTLIASLSAEIDGALRHTVRQFLDRDRFRNDDLASNFLARLLNAHGFQLFLLALALQRRERANLSFTIEVRDRQLLTLAAVVIRLDGGTRHLGAAGTALAAIVFFHLLAGGNHRPRRTNRLLDRRRIGGSRTAARRHRQFDFARASSFTRHVGRVAGRASALSLIRRTATIARRRRIDVTTRLTRRGRCSLASDRRRRSFSRLRCSRRRSNGRSASDRT